MEKVFNHLETLTFQTTNQNKNNFCRDFLFFSTKWKYRKYTETIW